MRTPIWVETFENMKLWVTLTIFEYKTEYLLDYFLITYEKVLVSCENWLFEFVKYLFIQKNIIAVKITHFCGEWSRNKRVEYFIAIIILLLFSSK